jgi:preprotein translocase subunit YajC
MTRKVKLFIVDEKPYLVSLDQIAVGDTVVVTVGGQYPSVVKCENEQIFELITNSKLTLTKPFKVVMEPDKITLNEDQINKLTEGDGVLEIVEENGVITFNL